MGFLDNSGDIILDAVLTDTGRFRLARGDGSFKIAKFALGDEEINYGNYDKNHASGSAYYDLKVLQTPILESFTNNTSTMKSKLISISRTNLLYLPRLKRNGVAQNMSMLASPLGTLEGEGNQKLLTAIACTDETINACVSSAGASEAAQGVIAGNPNDAAVADYNAQTNGIRIDQGLDTNEISPSLQIDQDLYETQYLIEIDNRFGSITPPGPTPESPIAYAFKDDDEIASYYVSDADASMVTNNTNTQSDAANQVIAGPRGSILRFSVKPSLELQQSTYLFDRYGGQETADGSSGRMNLGTTDGTTLTAATFKYIDTIVRVTGVTTGYRIDIPIRFLRKV
tara:strand:+ start:14541 stop:15566 length:1026 start_codon:yes stop_codon:yes gene_type:complete